MTDEASAAAAAALGFGPPESMTVKGRREPLTVRRWRAVAAAG